MRAVILGAGKGTRLRPLTETTPKPLIMVCGKSLLAHVLDALPSTVDEVMIVVGYLGHQIQEAFGDTYGKLRILYTTQEYLDGTAGALLLCKAFVEGPTLVVNADDLYVREDLARLVRHPLALLARLSNGEVLNPLEVSSSMQLRGFLPKCEIIPGVTYWQNCGAYMIDPRYFTEPVVEVPVRGNSEISVPHTLAALALHEPVHIVEATFWMPVGTPEELARANLHFC